MEREISVGSLVRVKAGEDSEGRIGEVIGVYADGSFTVAFETENFDADQLEWAEDEE